MASMAGVPAGMAAADSTSPRARTPKPAQTDQPPAQLLIVQAEADIAKKQWDDARRAGGLIFTNEAPRGAGCSAGLILTNEAPRSFTPQSLREALQRLLTAQEMSKVFDPLASTPEMQRWASNAVPATANDLQKAERLCQLLSTRNPLGPRTQGPPIKGPPVLEGSYRTASATFSVWDDPGQSLNCTDLAYFYVSLARALGVRAFCVNVEQDCDGRVGGHTCAAVFTAGLAVLADPAYGTFGVAHQKFVVLDDLQATGLFLSGVHDLETCQIAAKLAPNLLVVQMNLFDKLDQADRRTEAEQCLAAMEKLNPDAALTAYVAARLALRYGRLDQAVALLQKAIQDETGRPDFRQHCDELIARIKSNLAAKADSRFTVQSKGQFAREQQPDINRTRKSGWRMPTVLLLALTLGTSAASIVAYGRRQRRS
jgi:hypothetical protein